MNKPRKKTDILDLMETIYSGKRVGLESNIHDCKTMPDGRKYDSHRNEFVDLVTGEVEPATLVFRTPIRPLRGGAHGKKTRRKRKH